MVWTVYSLKQIICENPKYYSTTLTRPSYDIIKRYGNKNKAEVPACFTESTVASF